jgi:hypothetical protein
MPNPMGADMAQSTLTATRATQPNGHAMSARSNRITKTERRQKTRFQCDVPTACVVISLVEPVLLPVRIRNVSQRGLGLLVSTRVAPGSFIAVKVQGPRQKAPCILRARVIHATFLADVRVWLIGCVFRSELRKEELGQMF